MLNAYIESSIENLEATLKICDSVESFKKWASEYSSTEDTRTDLEIKSSMLNILQGAVQSAVKLIKDGGSSYLVGETYVYWGESTIGLQFESRYGREPTKEEMNEIKSKLNMDNFGEDMLFVLGCKKIDDVIESLGKESSEEEQEDEPLTKSELYSKFSLIVPADKETVDEIAEFIITELGGCDEFEVEKIYEVAKEIYNER